MAYQPKIEYTYQNVLVDAIRTVNEKWFAGDFVGSFTSYRMLFQWLPSEVKAEIKEEFEGANRMLNSINKQVRIQDLHLRHIVVARAMRAYLYEEILKLSNMTQDRLEMHGWLKKEGVTAKHPTMPTMRTQ